MADTKALTCKCVSGYQDTKYGPGKRLANRMYGPTSKGAKKAAKAAGASTSYRCTVCQAVLGA